MKLDCLVPLERAAGVEHPPIPPSLSVLNARITHIPLAKNGAGVPVRFMPDVHPEGYEAGIFKYGMVPTREHNWHDYFNALAWMAYPRSKSACNWRHHEAMCSRMAAGVAGRGPERDALTQFDECGVVVVSSADDVLQGLAMHEWEAVFWHAHELVKRETRFFVFGHATCEALQSPYFGLCAKALYRAVPSDWWSQRLEAQIDDIDQYLSQWFIHRQPLSPRAFSPLPLLGIPGMCEENAHQIYYNDTRQFRPLSTRK